MTKEYRMGSGRKINGEWYTLLTLADDEEDAKSQVRIWLGWLEKGHKVVYVEDEGNYLIYTCRPPEPPLLEGLYGKAPRRYAPIYKRRKSTMTTILLFTIAVILAIGLVAVLSVLCEIRDALADARAQMQRIADGLADEFEEDEWVVVRGGPPFGGKGQ